MALLNFSIIMGVLVWVAAAICFWPDYHNLAHKLVHKAWSRKRTPDPNVYVFAVTSPEHAKMLFKQVKGGAYDLCLQACLDEFAERPHSGFVLMVETYENETWRQWHLIRLENGECIRRGGDDFLLNDEVSARSNA